MKILVCVSEYPPHASGIGNVAYRMVKEFERKGHSCTVCSPTGPDIRLGSYDMIRRFGGLGVLHFWWRVSRYFSGKADQWDAVWLHGPLFSAKCPFPRAVITFHTTYSGYRSMTQEIGSSLFLKTYYAFMASVERRCLQAINTPSYYFSVVSPLVAAELNAYGICSPAISYISVGADTHRFHPVLERSQLRRELNIPDDGAVLLYVGRLTRQKNLFSLIDAYAQLRISLRQAILLIVGGGELQKQLNRYIEELEVADVRFLGFVPNNELPNIYSCADFFIMASEYEGQPVALLEAMASGLPPIVSGIPSMRQLVEESGAGIVVDFESPTGAASQIKAYMASSKALEDRNVVRRYVEIELSSAVCAEKYLELMQQPMPGGCGS